MGNNDTELRMLEQRVHKLETANAVEQERHSSIVKRLDKIDNHVTRLVWIIITAIVGAFIAFVSKGGLTIV